jgi:hypothetical protein
MSVTPAASEIIKTLTTALKERVLNPTPYKHWFLSHCLPSKTVDDMLALPFVAPELHGTSGKREVHNGTRSYYDVESRTKYPVADEVAQAFQSPEVVKAIETEMGISLKGSYLRLEYALDRNEFWLEPHTDLGVKLFTMLLYLSKDPQHTDLGTDVYADKETHSNRAPFESNKALIFVPSDNTWHGFEKREIKGIRASLIINYVTEDWKARDQLSFPTQTV